MYAKHDAESSSYSADTEDEELHQRNPLKDNSYESSKNCSGRSLSQIRDMLSVISEGGFKVGPNYELGSTGWRTMWAAAVNAMGGKKYRTTDSLPSVQQSNAHSHQHQRSGESKAVSKVSLPSISPSVSCYSSSKSAGRQTHGETISDAVSVLSKEKQVYLLQVLSKMESDLDRSDRVNPIGLNKPLKKKAVANIKYAFENKVKYGHVGSVLSEVSRTLRKIGIALEAPMLKQKCVEMIGRGKVERLGPTALRERLASELKVTLTTHEVALLMKKFDFENRGSVNIADVFGNAILITKKRFNGSKVQHSDDICESVGNKKCTKGKGKRKQLDAMDAVLQKLSDAAVESLKGGGRHVRFLLNGNSKTSCIEFRHMLRNLNVGAGSLTVREEKLLERRYLDAPSGLINLSAFVQEFKALGAKRLRHHGNAKGEMLQSSGSSSYLSTDEKGATGSEPERIIHKFTLQPGIVPVSADRTIGKDHNASAAFTPLNDIRDPLAENESATNVIHPEATKHAESDVNLPIDCSDDNRKSSSYTLGEREKCSSPITSPPVLCEPFSYRDECCNAIETGRSAGDQSMTASVLEALSDAEDLPHNNQSDDCTEQVRLVQSDANDDKSYASEFFDEYDESA